MRLHLGPPDRLVGPLPEAGPGTAQDAGHKGSGSPGPRAFVGRNPFTGIVVVYNCYHFSCFEAYGSVVTRTVPVPCGPQSQFRVPRCHPAAACLPARLEDSSTPGGRGFWIVDTLLSRGSEKKLRKRPPGCRVPALPDSGGASASGVHSASPRWSESTAAGPRHRAVLPDGRFVPRAHSLVAAPPGLGHDPAVPTGVSSSQPGLPLAALGHLQKPPETRRPRDCWRSGAQGGRQVGRPSWQV